MGGVDAPPSPEYIFIYVCVSIIIKFIYNQKDRKKELKERMVAGVEELGDIDNFGLIVPQTMQIQIL